MKITKAQVIEALTKEPFLKAGDWAYGDDPNCPVCAVGAVIRYSMPGLAVRDLRRVALSICAFGSATMKESVQDELGEKRYLNALSCYFEGLAEDRGDIYEAENHNDLRTEVIQFVQEHFPEGVIYDGE